MIYLMPDNKQEIELLPAAFRDAIRQLAALDVFHMQPGTYPLDGYDAKDAYFMVMDLDTIAFDERPPEIHREFIDIQYMPEGNETIGFAPETGNNPIQAGTDPEKLMRERDILFYDSAEYESVLHMAPGSIAIFFPWDVHRPACAEGAPRKVRKAVGKIHMKLVF